VYKNTQGRVKANPVNVNDKIRIFRYRIYPNKKFKSKVTPLLGLPEEDDGN